MSKKRKQNSSSRWTPFQSVLPYRNGKPMELKEHETYWQNSFYTVNKMLLEQTIFFMPPSKTGGTE